MVLQDLFDAVIADYVVTGKKSAQRVRQSYRHLIAYFGAQHLAEEITFSVITAYAAERLKVAKPGTVVHELRSLHRGMRLLERDGRLCKIPPFPTIKVRNARKTFVEAHQLYAILEHLRRELKPLILFYWFTGWRNKEALSLGWRNVDFTKGTVTLEADASKNEEPRVFPFTLFPELGRMLRDQRAATDLIERRYGMIVPWLFWRERKDPRAKNRGAAPVKGFDRAWKKACVKAGYPGKLIHDFRRSAVRRLEDIGIKRSVAMALVGHKTEAMYRRYDFATDPDKDQAVARIAEYLRGAKRTDDLPGPGKSP